MQILKEKIKRKEKELERIKKEYKELHSLIKKDSLEYNSEYIVNVSERVLSFVTGVYFEKYKMKPIYSLNKGTVWNNEGKSSGTNEIIYVHKNFWIDYRKSNSMLVGFICKIEDIFEAISEKHDLWLWYCKDRRYKKSFDDFFKEYNSKKIEFIKVYQEFLNSRNNFNNKKERDLFEIINEPSLKIKNMVVYLKE